jgi:hypothetical protein
MEWYNVRSRDGEYLQVLGLEEKELKNWGKVLGKSAEKEYQKLKNKKEMLLGMHEVYGISEQKQDEMFKAEDDMKILGTFLALTKSE